MATVTSIFYPTGETANGTVTTLTSSGEIVIGKNRLFVLTADQNMHLSFGTSGMAAADATKFKISAGILATYDTGSHVDRIRIYNPSGSTMNYYIQFLVR